MFILVFVLLSLSLRHKQVNRHVKFSELAKFVFEEKKRHCVAFFFGINAKPQINYKLTTSFLS